MKYKMIKILFVYGLIGLIHTPTNADIVLHEDFESGNMSNTTNSDGFRWSGNNRTSVVTIDPDCDVWPYGTSVAVYNNGAICNENLGVGSDWEAKNGKNSLRFRYPAGEEWTEQRWSSGVGYRTLWVAYWVRVPSNFTRTNTIGGTSNNKWIWFGQGAKQDVYSINNSANVWVRDLKNGDNINVDFQYINPKDGNYATTSSYSNFITTADQGRWMHIVYQLKMSSVNGAGDGALVMYRKWEDEGAYTKIISDENIDLHSGSVGLEGFAGGYLFGYANGTYAVDTDWLLDDFLISDTSLFSKPPIDLTVE
jgi:hypothetical protein